LTDSVPILPVSGLTIAYSAVEDRLVLWLRGQDQVVPLLFTRRLSALLINGLAGILARSSPAAAQAPAALRDDVILMEHQGAMAQSAAPTPDLAPPAPTEATAAPMLVETVNITTNPMDFQLIFRPPGGGGLAIKLSRADLHRVLELLRRYTQEADWALPTQPGWLTTQVTVN